MLKNKSYHTVDEYIADFPVAVALKLSQIREIITTTALQATETISYNMPAYKIKKVLAYFAAFKKHIGFYALPSGNDAFKKELSGYKTGKGSIQFSLNEALPLELIKKIVEFRLDELHKNTK